MGEEKLNRTEIIISTQMLSIGIILTIFGLIVVIFSPFKTMKPYIRMWALISDFGIVGLGLIFTIVGWVRSKKAKKERSQAS